MTKLPIIPTLVESYRLLFTNWRLYLRLIWLPAIVVFAADFLEGHYLPERFGAGSDEAIYLGIAAGLAGVILTIPVATAWSRLAIIDREDTDARLHYAFHREEWRFLWKTFILFLMVALILAFFIFIGEGGRCIWLNQCDLDPTWLDEDPILVAVLVLSLFCVVRFLFVLPAAAIAQPDGFRVSWRLTKGNGGRLAALWFLSLLPGVIFWVLASIYFLGEIFPEDSFYTIPHLIIDSVFDWFFFTIDIAALALGYKKLRADV